jgi:hypothetical protein
MSGILKNIFHKQIIMQGDKTVFLADIILRIQ